MCPVILVEVGVIAIDVPLCRNAAQFGGVIAAVRLGPCDIAGTRFPTIGVGTVLLNKICVACPNCFHEGIQCCHGDLLSHAMKYDDGLFHLIHLSSNQSHFVILR